MYSWERIYLIMELIRSDTESKECLVLTGEQISWEEAIETKDLEANEAAEMTLMGIKTEGEPVFEFEDELYGGSGVQKDLDGRKREIIDGRS